MLARTCRLYFRLQHAARGLCSKLPGLLCFPKQRFTCSFTPLAPPATVAILIWEDGWHLPQTAALTGWLLVLISSGKPLHLLHLAQPTLHSGVPESLACRCLLPIHVAGLASRVNAPSPPAQAGAALFSCVFPRRFWCRYVCPIGGMNGEQMSYTRCSAASHWAEQCQCGADKRDGLVVLSSR